MVLFMKEAFEKENDTDMASWCPTLALCTKANGNSISAMDLGDILWYVVICKRFD
jgi:hypothetical protein